MLAIALAIFQIRRVLVSKAKILANRASTHRRLRQDHLLRQKAAETSCTCGICNARETKVEKMYILYIYDYIYIHISVSVSLVFKIVSICFNEHVSSWPKSSTESCLELSVRPSLKSQKSAFWHSLTFFMRKYPSTPSLHPIVRIPEQHIQNLQQI